MAGVGRGERRGMEGGVIAEKGKKVTKVSGGEGGEGIGVAEGKVE